MKKVFFPLEPVVSVMFFFMLVQPAFSAGTSGLVREGTCIEVVDGGHFVVSDGKNETRIQLNQQLQKVMTYNFLKYFS